jgi:hypothetical protein
MSARPTLVRGLLVMGLALLVGSFVWIGIDVLLRSFPPYGEMHPAIGLFFVPILCAPIFLITSLLHIVLRRFFGYDQWIQWLVAGAMYSLVMLLIVGGWWMLLVPAAVNPITLRLLERVVGRLT